MDITAFIQILSLVLASIAAFIGLTEYRKRTKLQSFEILERFRMRYMQLNHELEPILDIEENQVDENHIAQLNALGLGGVNDFLGLYDEIAIAVNSGLINKSVAYYMFGYYAEKANREWFWRAFYNGEGDWNAQAKSDWRIFIDFAEKATEWRKDNLAKAEIRL